MSDLERESHGRLKGIKTRDLTHEQREMWDSITSGARGTSSTLAQGDRLGGPFDAWLRSPAPGGRAAALGEALRFQGSMDPILREVVILTAGAWWRSNFEFWAHERIALELGIEQSFIDQIATGTVPDGDHTDPMIFVYFLSQSLLEHGHLDDDTYFAAARILGVESVVELVLLVGYYTSVSLTLNVFRVAPPEELPLRWS